MSSQPTETMTPPSRMSTDHQKWRQQNVPRHSRPSHIYCWRVKKARLRDNRLWRSQYPRQFLQSVSTKSPTFTLTFIPLPTLTPNQISSSRYVMVKSFLASNWSPIPIEGTFFANIKTSPRNGNGVQCRSIDIRQQRRFRRCTYIVRRW